MQVEPLWHVTTRVEEARVLQVADVAGNSDFTHDSKTIPFILILDQITYRWYCRGCGCMDCTFSVPVLSRRRRAGSRHRSRDFSSRWRASACHSQGLQEGVRQLRCRQRHKSPAVSPSQRRAAAWLFHQRGGRRRQAKVRSCNAAMVVIVNETSLGWACCCRRSSYPVALYFIIRLALTATNTAPPLLTTAQRICCTAPS
jgi:hypothetical protein